jgi:hypothetical protein
LPQASTPAAPSPSATRQRAPGDRLGSGAAERAIADDRVGRVGVDVEHRREVDVEAERRQLAAQRRADVLGERAVGVGRVVVVGQHRRPLRRRRAHPLHHPALLIDRDQERQVGGRGGVQLRGSARSTRRCRSPPAAPAPPPPRPAGCA